ncbi:MAG: glycoside hydrolase TIM-barrel-like domain-containing protein, partial [Rhizobiaceae bacterium]
MPTCSDASTNASSNWLRHTHAGWSRKELTQEQADLVRGEWFFHARIGQYPLKFQPATWLVLGGRGAGKTRLGAEWVNGLARGFSPFALKRHDRIALVGETLSDVREVMIEGPSGIVTISRRDRPRFEPSRRRLVWDNGAVAQIFSSEDPDSLRGPQFAAAWCDELGCPAVDKGPNQPNVFPDPKSAESALPYFSDGGRSDIAQRRFIEAHADHWDPNSPAFDDAGNPVSAVYGGRMVDASRIYLWAWDARPYPAFPQRDDEWSDHGNWHYGHWLNGRLASPSVGDLVNAILGDHACAPAVVAGVEATVPGYVIYDPTSARAALEPLVDLFGLACLETGGTLAFRGAAAKTGPAILVEDKVLDDGLPVLEQVRPPDHQLPGEAVLTFRDPMTDYQSVTVRDRRVGTAGHRQETISFPGVLEAGQGRALAGDWMRRMWSERERIGFAVGPLDPFLVPGAVVRLPETGDREFLITQIEDGLVRRVAARQVARGAPTRWESSNARQATAAWPFAGTPLAWFLDLPLMDGSSLPQDWFRLAAWQTPWRGQAVFSSPEESGYALRASVASPATVGTLTEPLAAGPLGRIDLGNYLTVRLNDGELASVSRGHVLNGANAIAVQSASGVWEISQFEQADEVEPGVWRLSRLLRGQFGTDDATAAGALIGARVVVLDETVRPAGLRSGEAGLHLNWRVGPRAGDFSAASFALR